MLLILSKENIKERDIKKKKDIKKYI